MGLFSIIKLSGVINYYNPFLFIICETNLKKILFTILSAIIIYIIYLAYSVFVSPEFELDLRDYEFIDSLNTNTPLVELITSDKLKEKTFKHNLNLIVFWSINQSCSKYKYLDIFYESKEIEIYLISYDLNIKNMDYVISQYVYSENFIHNTYLIDKKPDVFFDMRNHINLLNFYNELTGDHINEAIAIPYSIIINNVGKVVNKFNSKDNLIEFLDSTLSVNNL